MSKDLLANEAEGRGFVVEPLEKGGSGRLFYRLRFGELSVVFVKYNDHREENRHYVEIARFLAHCGVSVPKIYFHDEAEGMIWMQDLGDADLWSFRRDDWEVRSELYGSALRQVARLHGRGVRELSRFSVTLQRQFDETLYLWEQDYFFEHGARGVLGLGEEEIRALSALPALRRLAERLAELPRCLIHRDFQSQNVLIYEGTAWLIDFQGMRFGLPQYDVASLIYDPYVELTERERAELVRVYLSAAEEEGYEPPGDFGEVLLGCAAQRLMQALGAYGFLGLRCGYTRFLRYVPAARRSLCEVLSRIEGLEPAISILENACEPTH
ncbi:MAG: phosphotransferase [Chthoniobacterales bacterium]|nr:phosphotransferase [Chthoniobacterales bacterium]